MHVCRLFDDEFRLIWNDSTIISMLNMWVKNKVIDFCVEHKVDIAEVVDEPLFLFGPLFNVFESENEVGEV